MSKTSDGDKPRSLKEYEYDRSELAAVEEVPVSDSERTLHRGLKARQISMIGE